MGIIVSIYMILSFTITVEKERNHQTNGRVNWSRESQTITNIGKRTCSKWCVGVLCVERCRMGMVGSRKKFLVWRFCFVWSLGWNFENEEELKAPGPRIVQIHSLQGTPPVPFLNNYFRAYKTCCFSLAWFLYLI